MIRIVIGNICKKIVSFSLTIKEESVSVDEIAEKYANITIIAPT